MINLECLSAACILPLLYDSLKLCVATISAVPGHAVLAVPDDAVPAVLGGAVPAGDSHTKPLRPKYMNISKKSTKTFCIQAKCVYRLCHISAYHRINLRSRVYIYIHIYKSIVN